MPISADDATAELLAVLRESCEGPPEGGSYFTDNDPAAGLFGTLDGLTSEAASREIAGSSAAAHAHHAAFGMEAAAAWIRGDRSKRDWSESWSVRSVDGPAWSRLRETVRARYGDLRRAIESDAAGSRDAVGGAVGAIAHVAYHLGAIRQKAAAVRAGP